MTFVNNGQAYFLTTPVPVTVTDLSQTFPPYDPIDVYDATIEIKILHS